MKQIQQTSTPLIIGVGASVGGLEAFQELLHSLGDAQDLAIVFVQHLEKERDELLIELLTKSTPLAVVSVTGRKKLKPGTVYVCPPWTLLELKNASLRIAKPENDERPTAPIDYFLQSLAEDQGERGVGVILSGTGSDGTLGLKTISDAGGMTFAQSADSAKQDSMPRSAATAGVADHVLAPNEIAAELKKYANYLTDKLNGSQEKASDQQIHDAIPAIAKLLMQDTSHNFQHYKPSTLGRRIRRRMHVLKLANVDTYIKFLKDDPEESHRLFRELLISVTAFFRDPEAFDVLSQTVIPTLFANRKPNDVVRIWVPGCATGEEAFTLAMLCRETMDQMDSPPQVQIFATDIDQRALKISRQGTYPIGIEEDISEERLKRFFIKRGKKYQIVKEVRELVLFSVHNLISDPPFSRLDLISCRNLLIYLGPHLQKKLIPLFHYALRPAGFLMLGPSENISSHGELFGTVDVMYRISQRKETGVDASAALSLTYSSLDATTNELNRTPEPSLNTYGDLMQVMQRIVLDEFAPNSVIVEEDGKILCASADMHKYLTVGTGKFQNNIIKMARTGLRIGLRATLQAAKAKRRRIVHDDLSVRIDGKLQRVMLTVQPMPRVGENAELFMVVFHDCGLPLARDKKGEQTTDVGLSESASTANHGTDAIIAHLERELSSTRDDLEKSIHEYEMTNEELKASNEELLSLNEEMQSANEELKTSKEEIQAGITALAKAHSDLKNLFQSTQIATLFLDAKEQLIRFTPAAGKVYNLISTDVGRPLAHITHKAIEMPPIPNLAELALANNFVEQEIQSLNGRWFSRRALPYFHKGRAEGVILTFIDISERKRAVIRLAAMHQVTRILASDPAMEDIFPEVLRAISETLNAAYCAIWLVNSESKSLNCTESFFDPNRPELRRFSDESRRMVFEYGSGLPGRVWQSRETHWIELLGTDKNFTRQNLAAEAGLVSGVALPIVIGSRVYGVIEIFTEARLERDDALQDMLHSLGNEIGQFIVRKRLDEKLRDEEARKSAILDAALDAIVTMDREGRIVDFNPAAERAFGFTREEVQGQLLSETIIPHEYREAHVAGLARYLKTGIATVLGRRLELTAMRKDGSVFPVELAISDTTARDGTPFFTAHLRDIAEHKQFVQTIVDRDNRITALLNSTAEGIYGINLDGLCTFANASCARLLGFESPDDFVGRSMHELIHHTLPGGQPYPVEDCKIYRAFRLGESVHADDELYWRADGSSFDVEYWSYPQIQNGKVVGCVVSFLDISERKKWESELADREAHLRRVIDNMLGFVGVLDLQGVLREVNETAIIAGGLTRDDVIGKPFWDCYWWSHDEQVIEDLKAAITTALTGEVVRYDVEVRMAGDSPLAIDFMLAPVKDAEGKVTHLIPSGVDISERKFAELEVQQRVNQLNLVLESGRMGLWEWDIAADHVTWSSQLYETFGYTDETFVPTRAGFLAIVHPNDRPNIELMILSAFNTSCVNHEVEFRVIRGDTGELVWTHSQGTIRRGTDGTPLGILTVSVDITGRKQRELTLAFLAELQSTLAGLASAEAIIAAASQKVAEYLELSHFLLIEMDEHAAKATVISDHCSDESASLIGVYAMTEFATEDERQRLVAGQPMVVNDTAASTRSAGFIKNFAALKIGSIINAPSSRDKHLGFMLTATKQQPYAWRDDEIDMMRQLANILRLKLERALAETALKESQEQLRLGVEVADFALAQIDYSRDSVHLSSEAAKLYGLGESESDVTREQIHQTFHPEDRDELEACIQKCLEPSSDGELSIKHRIILPNGEVRWVEVRKRIFFDHKAKLPHPTHGILAARDITAQKHWEIELADREAHLRRVINSQLGLVGVIDRNGMLVEVDDRSMSIAGLTRDDVIGKHFAECAWWTYDDAISQKMRESMKKAFAGERVRYDVALYAQGDQRLMIDFMIAPVRDADGNITHLIPSGVDISERKLAEQQLAESKDRLSMAMASARMGSYEWEPDSDKVTWDDQHRSITGLRKDQSTGADFLKLIHPDDVEANQLAIKNTISGKCDYETEFRITRPDGKVRWLAARGKIVKADGDRPLRFVGMNWDITVAKEQEQQIRESEERLRNAAEAAGFGTFHADLVHGAMTYSKEFRLLVGMPDDSDGQFLSNDVPDWVYPDDREGCHKQYMELARLSEGTNHQIDHRIIKPDGEIRWVRLQAKPIYTGKGVRRKETQLIGTVIDITPQRLYEQSLMEARREAEAANQSKSEFLANMSHEIRTPMTAILGYTDLVAEKINDEETMQHVRTIRRNGDFLLDIINDILDLSKIEAGKFEVNQQLFSPQRLVEDVRSIMEVRATACQIELDVEYRGAIPEQIESDPKRLRQVLINLVGNAIKFTTAGTVRVVVSYSANDGKLRFDVIDTGIGISDKQRRRLFQPFSQGDGNVNREFGGTGLGLAISKRLTEMLGGEISVESELGKGSTFTVSITPGNVHHIAFVNPAAKAHEHQTSKVANDIRLDCHVLVVDDRRDIRFLSERFLTGAGATVDEAEDGEVAVATVTKAIEQGKTYDLILLDMQMPKMDGYATAKALRQLGFAEPIVALTADAMQGDMNRCIESGCNDYLSKPIDKALLLKLVQHLTQKRK